MGIQQSQLDTPTWIHHAHRRGSSSTATPAAGSVTVTVGKFSNGFHWCLQSLDAPGTPGGIRFLDIALTSDNIHLSEVRMSRFRFAAFEFRFVCYVTD